MKHFLAVKFYRLWEKYEFLCDTKISKRLKKKKVEKIGLGRGTGLLLQLQNQVALCIRPSTYGHDSYKH